jgi:transcription elongation factor GreA
VELPAPLPTAPIELTRVGKWLERRPELRLDGREPSSRAVMARLAAFWLPSATVLFIGSASSSVANRVEAIRTTVLGERRPHSAGHWLHVLTAMPTTRIWWSPTAAVEEYEDALLEAFAATVPAADRAGLHDATIVLPFANLRTPTGGRKMTGLTGSVTAAEPRLPSPEPRIVELPPGDADGLADIRPTRAAGGTTRRTPRQPRPRSARPDPAPTMTRAAPATTWLSADGQARLETELAELVGTRRPEVIARIKAAKELGDLRENADYTAAREEQSFLEGRIATIQTLLRDATLIQTSSDIGDRVTIGSTVTVDGPDGERIAMTIVGSAEADPAAGRISNASPVGRALLGHVVGDTVVVITPRGEASYQVVAID